MKFSRVKDYDDLLKFSSTPEGLLDIQKNISRFIEFCKQKGLSYNTIHSYVSIPFGLMLLSYILLKHFFHCMTLMHSVGVRTQMELTRSSYKYQAFSTPETKNSTLRTSTSESITSSIFPFTFSPGLYFSFSNIKSRVVIQQS